MKYLKVYSLSLLAMAVAGCGGLGKMEKNASTVKYEVTPNPLEEHGDSVAITVKGTYPAKYFSKKANLVVTPVIKTSSNTDVDFGAAEVKGEKATAAKGSTISYKTGGGFTYTGKIPYTPEMRAGEVMVKVKGTQGKKTKDFAPIKIADATITTPLLASKQGSAIYAKDAYVRTINKSYNGMIYYPINQSSVSAGFKHKDAGIVNKTTLSELDSIMSNIKKESFTLKAINITGNASPDGKTDLNTKLADARSKSASKYLEASMNKGKAKVKAKGKGKAEVQPTPESEAPAMNLCSNSEDWPGFQKLMQESDMAQKDMILRIVSSNSDADAREMEIKKMGLVFSVFAVLFLL